MTPYCSDCWRRRPGCLCERIAPKPVAITRRDIEAAAKALGIRDTLGASIAKVAQAIAEAR